MRALKVCLFILSLLSVVVEVCYGGLNLELIATMTGENSGDGFGKKVAGVGDINGDGYSDIAIYAIGYADGAGKVYIYLGSPEFDEIPDIMLKGEETTEFFGFGISGADVNNDGYSDIIIGVPGYNSGSGRVYLYFGGGEFDTIPDLTFEDSGGYFGWDVASAGDANKDGFDDIIVSASAEGRVYLYLGGEIMDTVADAIFSEDEGIFGRSISSAGDVNGDGYDDIIVGSTYNSFLFLGGEQIDTTADLVFSEGQDVTSGDFNADGFSDVFTSFGGIYFGGINMDTTVDVHSVGGDGASGHFNKGIYCDLLVGNSGSFGGLGSAWVFLGGNPMDSIPDWGVVGTNGGCLGASVSSAGDVNGDSVEDVIIGEPPNGSGKAYVYQGDPSGVEDWNPPYQVPREFELEQNYPNPFNSTTAISYQLSEVRPHHTTLKVYNLLGQEVKTLVGKRQRSGCYSVTWDGKDSSGRQVGSGIYFYRLEVEGLKAESRKLKAEMVRKMVLIR